MDADEGFVIKTQKLNRLRKTKKPCEQCGLHLQRCICHLIPKLILKSKLVLVIHAKELKRTTNSGKLALLALENSTQRIRGEGREALDLSDLLLPEYESLLFYPSDNAVELNLDLVRTLKKPVQLIVPDGSWRQASKVHTRHPELAGLKRVMITAPNQAEHHLRRESSSYGMSTLEAIAKAFSVLEGADVGQTLQDLYQAKLQATLAGRGQLNTQGSEAESLDPET